MPSALRASPSKSRSPRCECSSRSRAKRKSSSWSCSSTEHCLRTTSVARPTRSRCWRIRNSKPYWIAGGRTEEKRTFAPSQGTSSVRRSTSRAGSSQGTRRQPLHRSPPPHSRRRSRSSRCLGRRFRHRERSRRRYRRTSPIRRNPSPRESPECSRS